MSTNTQKVFVIFNPTAGNATQADAVRAALKQHFDEPDWECEVYETTGDEDIAAISRKACDDGASMVISAGGDGTLIGVANGLIHKDVPLGILPLGTGNDLARILSIPLQLEGALGVLSGEHDVFEMDALKVDDCYYFSNVSVGITPHMMNDTLSAQKKRFGRLAYIWTMFKQSKLFQMRNYQLTIDNRTQRVNAVEIMVSNSTLLDSFPQLFGSLETITDGKLELYLVKARTWRDYLQIAWNLIRRPEQRTNRFIHLDAKESIRIEAVKHSQLVQADGDAIGHTPVEVRLEPKALRVIKPKTAVPQPATS